jgi:transcription termination/antitermination protein NusG
MDTQKSTEIHWKVVYVASRQEKKVSAYLDKQSIEHYLPLYRSLRFWKDRKKWVEMPLFNGYIFVKPTELERDMVLQTPGVVKYIRHDQKDARVPEKQIELIKELVELGYNISEVSSSEKYEKGDIAEVLDGPLKGQEAEIFKIGYENYVFISIEAVNKSVKVQLPKDILKIVQKKSEMEDFKPIW